MPSIFLNVLHVIRYLILVITFCGGVTQKWKLKPKEIYNLSENTAIKYLDTHSLHLSGSVPVTMHHKMLTVEKVEIVII